MSSLDIEQALRNAHKTLCDITLVGITIEPGKYGKEVRMRQLACSGIFDANRALELLDAEKSA